MNTNYAIGGTIEVLTPNERELKISLEHRTNRAPKAQKMTAQGNALGE